MSSWNFADVWETVADTLPGAPATAHGWAHHDWHEFNRRADGIAAWLVAAHCPHHATFAQYLHSRTEYVEALFGAFKAGIAPVNTNYRYSGGELVYLWDNADCAAVIFEGGFTERIESIRSRVPGVRNWLWVDDGAGSCPAWADDLAEVAGAGVGGGSSHSAWGRSPDDLFLLYTGGTTGMPKGVMWRQDDLFALNNRTAAVRYPEDGSLLDVRVQLVKPGPAHVPCAPLTHGTGVFTSMSTLSSGGSIVTLTSHSFSAEELLDTVEDEGVKSIAIVGDAFAKPILAALDPSPAGGTCRRCES